MPKKIEFPQISAKSRKAQFSRRSEHKTIEKNKTQLKLRVSKNRRILNVAQS